MVVKKRKREIGGKEVSVEILPHSDMRLGSAEDLIKSLDEMELIEKNEDLFKIVANDYANLLMKKKNNDKLQIHFELGKILRKLDSLDISVEEETQAYSGPARYVFSHVIELVAEQINSKKIKFNHKTVHRYAYIEWKLANIDEKIVFSEGMKWGQWSMILHYNSIYKSYLNGDKIIEEIILFYSQMEEKSFLGDAPFRKYLQKIDMKLKEDGLN